MKSRFRRAIAALLAVATALCLASCETPATQVLVQLATDLAENRTVVVRVAAQQTDADGGTFGRQTNWTFTRGGPLGERTFPGTFGVTPPSGAPRDARMQLVISVFVAANSDVEPALFFRRTVRFRFTPNRTLGIGVFLSLHCGEPATGCTGVSPADCTVSTLCEERGLTCGNGAECIAGEVMPMDIDAGFGDAGGPMDASTSDIVDDVRSDVPVPTVCAADSDCAGTIVPRCDTSAHRCVDCLGAVDCATNRSGSACHATDHRCVPCALASDCMGSTEGAVCNTVTGRCGQCGASSDCTGTDAGRVCSLATGLCTACTRDSECTGHPAGPLCDTASGRCVACTASADRCAGSEHCDAASGTCVAGCHDDSGCLLASSRHCDATMHTCVACTSDAHCPPGTHCTGGSCASGCSDASQCSPGQSCCGGACTDVLASEASCGACGTACAPPNAIAACVSGTCTIGECTAPFLDCNGTLADGCEANRLTSALHCGACGRSCMAGPNATAMCVSGVCSRSCAAGFADCNGDPSDGCEVTLATDAAHCGACGRACTVENGVGACSAGMCTVASCAAGFADCNGSIADGCEIDTTSDVSNCGACAAPCVRAPGVYRLSCAAGRCNSSCYPNTADCDGVAANGCEVDLNVSLSSCGMCGRACSLPHTNPVCYLGTCLVSTCNAGYGDCDGVTTNGCETDLSNTDTSCGSCGAACTPVPNATRSCRGFACAITCAPQYGDCDFGASNGCEIGPIHRFPVSACMNIASAATISGLYPPRDSFHPFSNITDSDPCTDGQIFATDGYITFTFPSLRSVRGITATGAISTPIAAAWDVSTSTDGTTFTSVATGMATPLETWVADFGSNRNVLAIRVTIMRNPDIGVGFRNLDIWSCP